MDSADNCLDLILFRSFYSLKSIKIQPWTSFSQTSLVTVVSSSLLLHIHNYSGFAASDSSSPSELEDDARTKKKTPNLHEAFFYKIHYLQIRFEL
ncbi:hypothetical protein YC2023_022218 [Brassica napus]